MKLGIVVAVAEHGGIGLNGKLPWKLKGDMAFFKEITSRTDDAKKSNAVVMGRKTWESIPIRFRPLPNRINHIISTNMQPGLHTIDENKQFFVFSTFEQSLAHIESTLTDLVESVYIIGGYQLFKSVLQSDLPLTIYMTRVLGSMPCDVFFPEVDFSSYEKLQLPYVDEDVKVEEGLKYRFEVFRRN